MPHRRCAGRGPALLALSGILVLGSAMLAAPTWAQSTECPAGAPGGAAGDAGRSVAGRGGLGFSIGPFATGSTAGNVDARGGDGGDARGGAGGRGGSGSLPICNHNTNIAPAAAAPTARPPASPGPHGDDHHAVRGSGGGHVLARTGANPYAKLAVAGSGFVLGGALLFFGQPGLRRRRS